MTADFETLWPDPSVAADLTALRGKAPLVHCLTNVVASALTANVLLAIGAAPAMVIDAEEAAMFAGIASSLLVNLGTITVPEADSIRSAVRAARSAGVPWVLDPVAVGALPLRTRLARELLAFGPKIIRGNASEIMALAGLGAGGRGVDSTAGSSEAVDAARALARQTGAVVAVSGIVDYVTDGTRIWAVPGGHVLMTRVTGVGCALGAVLAAFAAVSATPLQAAVSASVVYGEAGARAGRVAKVPGSYAVALLDALAEVGRDGD